eukprot:766926-Hanusia_phi.AAC.2
MQTGQGEEPREWCSLTSLCTDDEKAVRENRKADEAGGETSEEMKESNTLDVSRAVRGNLG